MVKPMRKFISDILRKGLLFEDDSNKDCLNKFGKELFGDQFGGFEKNTKLEDEYVKLIKNFSDVQFGSNINPKIINALQDLKNCTSTYPEILVPESETVYRGSVMKLGFFIKNGLKLSEELIDYNYIPRTPIQSWSANEKIAMEFMGYYDGDLVNLGKLFSKYQSKGVKYEDKFFLDILTKSENLKLNIPVLYIANVDNNGFLFKHEYFNKLTGENEDEVIRVSSEPINVKLKVNSSKLDRNVINLIKAYNDLLDYGLDNGDPYKPIINESIDRTIKCGNCGWSWKESTSEPDDLYNCHKCGYDNEPKGINEGIVKSELVNIEDDNLYDSLEMQADELRANSEISFGSADPFEILYDDNTGELIGATWIETSGAFSPHMIIKPKYRKLGLSKQLIDGVVEKYKKMKEIRGDEYTFMLNVVNSSLANTMEKHYGFKIIEKDPKGNVTMTI
jgi:hypothetical protein